MMRTIATIVGTIGLVVDEQDDRKVDYLIDRLHNRPPVYTHPLLIREVVRVDSRAYGTIRFLIKIIISYLIVLLTLRHRF